MAHRETLLPPDLSLAWQLQRLHPEKGRALSPRVCLRPRAARRGRASSPVHATAPLRPPGRAETHRRTDARRLCAVEPRLRVSALARELHVIPQSWYIWDARGAVQCECLLAREPIRKAAGILRSSTDLQHDLLRHGHLWMQPSAAFHVLMLERPLVEQVERQLADAPFGACYRPQPRPPAPNNASCW